MCTLEKLLELVNGERIFILNSIGLTELINVIGCRIWN